jgi:hypothetical protein
VTDLRPSEPYPGIDGGNDAGRLRLRRTLRLRPPERHRSHAPARVRIRPAAAQVTPAALWRHHRLFTVVVLVSLAPRIIAALGFRPALLIQDSFPYMEQGVHLTPLSPLRPEGYPLFLQVLEPFHSLLLVTALQHLMGIATGVIIYAVLRSRRLPAWGATLAAAPTLFDPRQIWLESSILADTLFQFVIVVAVVLLLTRRAPRTWQTALAGLLVAWASVIRGNGAPIFVAVFIFLLIRRVGWRALLACVAAFAIPLAGYMLVFFSEYGQFTITDSTGLFAWSRTMSFADCAVIKPPPDLRPLCRDRQAGHPAGPAPAWSLPYLLNERSPSDYLWAPDAWYRTDAHPGVNGYNNKLGEQFAIRAVEAQPLAYLKAVGEGVMLTFLDTDRSSSYLSMYFSPGPHVTKLAAYQRHDENLYAHTTRNTHAVQPWAFFMFLYQSPVYFTGIAFFLVMLVGLVGVIRHWRRWGAFAVLPWAVAFIDLVVPIALADRSYRYAISGVPLACLALGLAVARRPRAAAGDGAGPPATG